MFSFCVNRNQTVFKPVAFISEIFDLSKSAHKKYQDKSSMSSSTFLSFASSNALTSSSSCLHEDGGELAIFEENKEVGAVGHY